jgi:uncharacterized membrane protein
MMLSVGPAAGPQQHRSNKEVDMTRVTFPLLALPLGLGFFGFLSTLHASAYLENNGVFTVINVNFAPFPPGPLPQGINDSGQIVGYTSAAGFLYAGGSATPIFDPLGSFTFPFGIDDAGVIVGSYNSPGGGGEVGFIYANGLYTSVAYPGAGTTELLSISSNGQMILGAYGTVGGASGLFLDSGGTLTPLNIPWGGGTAGINNAGDIVETHTVYYSNGLVVTISLPGASLTDVYGINDLGQIVGTAYFAGGTSEGFVDTNGVFQFINFPGAQPVTTANAINDVGEIAGTFAPIPEPASLVLVGAGLAGIAVIKLRRRYLR